MASTDDEPFRPRGASVFGFMMRQPALFMIALPAIYVALLIGGWTRDDKVQMEVAEIWIPTRGELARNLDYLNQFDAGSRNQVSAGAMMALSRDGGNMLTATRLEEIRTRMEEMESVTIEYNGVTYTWDDVCASNNLGRGTVYQAPCFRISPMDLFQEARWFFGDVETDPTDRLTWYDVVVSDSLAGPLIPRFGVMTTNCVSPQGSPACDIDVGVRLDPNVAQAFGLPASHANPLELFSDIFNMQMSDPCRICFEEGLVQTIDDLFAAIRGSFGVLALELQRFQATLNPSDPEWPAVLQNLQWAATLSQSVTRETVEDFFYYFVVRGAYIQLGVPTYLAGYTALAPLLSQCMPPLLCPPLTTNVTEAQAALARHADNAFSSVTTAGNPFPFWSAGDGTGFLFAGNQPVSGSGIDMSGPLLSFVAYLDIQNFGTENWSPLYINGASGFANPLDPAWEALVAHNPIYNWFTADLIEADEFCNNGVLTGTNTGIPELDGQTAFIMASISQNWCTPHRLPTATNRGTPPYTRQWFARLWYDYLIDSPGFLNIRQGTDDPYTWTAGIGCGYDLRGQRDSYTNRTEAEILLGASRELYYIDEGSVAGAIDRNLIISSTPEVGNYSFENPLQTVPVFQNLYLYLVPTSIVDRVRNCNRPGGPVDITIDDAEFILQEFKAVMEDVWSRGWNNASDGEVQFSAFTDDVGAQGTTAAILTDITLDNGRLTTISILSIAVFSVLFLFDPDPVQSRAVLALIGVTLVVLSFFSSIGVGLLSGIRIDITIAWTLPFIILGLGVDDMYIVLEALNSQEGYTDDDFLAAMAEVVAPVTMTSTVNACMFAILNVSDLPAVHLTARVAVICVVFLYLAVIVCFPAYCYLDMKRQERGQWDCLFWKTSQTQSEQGTRTRDFRAKLLFDNFYEPLVLGKAPVRMIVQALVWICAIGLFASGCYGVTQRRIGLGLEDFVPADEQAFVWANERTESLASYPVSMNWGDLNYTDPNVQMKMLRQYERVIDTFYFAEADTRFVWMAQFLLWTSRLCGSNVETRSTQVDQCGADFLFEGDGTYCTGMWTENVFGLREQAIPGRGDECEPFSGGICRSGRNMHFMDLAELGVSQNVANTKTFCPIVDGWSDEKWQYCLLSWRNATNFGGGGFIFEEENGSETDCPGEFNQDENFTWPIPLSTSPTMFAIRLFTHEDTVEMIRQAAEFCEDDPDLYCFMTGVPIEYWNQYLTVYDVLIELATYAIVVGFAISFIFLFVQISRGSQHSMLKVFVGSYIGALLIATTLVISFFTVFGLSAWGGTNLTAFSNMSYILSIGFATEYSVHIVARWLQTDLSLKTSVDRVRETMSFLVLPTFMSFVSSTLGVLCLAFTDFEFNRIYFFQPLIITMLVTYFYGCWWLPCVLTLLDFDAVRLGKPMSIRESLRRSQMKREDLERDMPAAAEEREVAAPVEDTPSEPVPAPEPEPVKEEEAVAPEPPAPLEPTAAPVAAEEAQEPEPTSPVEEEVPAAEAAQGEAEAPVVDTSPKEG